MINIGLSLARHIVPRLPKGKTILINGALALFGDVYDGAIKIPDGRIFFIDKITSGNRSLFFRGDIDSIETELIRKIVRPGMVAFDIGASYGWYMTLFAQCIAARGKVFAFEPAPNLASILRNVVQLNRYAHVTVEGSAIGQHDGVVDIFYSERQGTSNQDSHLIADARQVAIQIPMKSLDSYCQQHKVDKIDFLKSDVDGPEMAVLRGGREILKTKPVILIEVNDQFQRLFGESSVTLVHELETMGYRCYAVGRPCKYMPSSHIPEGYSDNVLAIPNSRLEELRSVLPLQS